MAYNDGESEWVRQKVLRRLYLKCETLKRAFRRPCPKCETLTMREEVCPPAFFQKEDRKMEAAYQNFGFYHVALGHYLIYEQIPKEELGPRDIYKEISDNEVRKLFSMLEIKKMIPVKPELCERIDFGDLADKRYVDLLEKEYRFLPENTGWNSGKGKTAL